jgi:hypothetical protein
MEHIPYVVDIGKRIYDAEKGQVIKIELSDTKQIGSFKTLAPFNQTSWNHIPEYNIIHTKRLNDFLTSSSYS